MKVAIDSIVVGERQRLDLGDIDSMANSLAKYGQINPIHVKPLFDTFQYELIAGMRRLTAAKKLGWTEIDVTTADPTISTLHQQEVELEEDIQRKDRTWQEKCIAMLKLHRLKKYSDPEWSMRLTAKCVGKSVGHVAEVLNVAEVLERTKSQLEQWEKDIWSTSSFPEAVNIIMDKNIAAATSELERRRSSIREGLKIASTATSSQGESVARVETPRQPTAIKIYDQQTTGTILRALAYVNCQKELDPLTEALSRLSETGCAVIWFAELGLFKDMTGRMRDFHFLPANHFPLIWNIIEGPKYSDSPFILSYHVGMFIRGSSWKGLDQQADGVVTAAHNGSDMPIQIVQHSLDAMGAQTNDLVWLPLNGPIVEVAQCGMTPVFNPDDVKRNELIAHYQRTFGSIEIL